MLIGAATASLLPYLTIHMQSIGLTVDEISMVYLALPLTTFLSPPITGMYCQFRNCIVSIILPSYFLFKAMVGFDYYSLCMDACVHVYVCTCAHRCLCLCLYVCVCVCARARACACVCVRESDTFLI
jgi:hypothetical protein